MVGLVMFWQYSYLIIVLLSTIISITLALTALRFRKHSRAVLYFTPMMLFVGEWCITSFLICISHGNHATMLWIYARYTGLALMVPFFLGFVCDYTGHERWLTRNKLLLLFVIPVMTIFLSWTNDIHGLMIEDIHYSMDGPVLYVDGVTFGSYYWVHTIYCYSIIMSGIFLLVRMSIQSFYLYRRQAITVTLGAAIAIAATACDAFALVPAFKHAISPIGFTIMGIAFSNSIFRHQFLNIVPIARHMLVDSMLDGMIVLDKKGIVVDINYAAQKCLAIHHSSVIGHPVAESLNMWEQCSRLTEDNPHLQSELLIENTGGEKIYDVRFSRIYNRQSRHIGYLVLLHDITLRKKMDIELRISNDTLKKQLQEINVLQFQLQKQVVRDPLTGLFNRRYLEESLEQSKNLAERGGFPLSLLMADIDHFKEINDTHGHQIGDRVLVWLSAQLCANTRSGDLIYRFGGEEFLILLQNASPEIAAMRAEKIRAAIETAICRCEGTVVKITISIGTATFPIDGQDMETVIRAADTALYSAKSGGRNRIVCAH